MSIQLCSDDGIEFQGQRYVPDATKAYFQFALSHAFPVATVFGTALHPAVIEKSFRSLLHQNLNFEHRVQAYRPKEESEADDRVIGSIISVHFPQTPPGGWRLGSFAESPHITGVATVYKQAKGMAQVLGHHVTGRRKYSVSMEVLWPFEDAGFAIATNGQKPLYNFQPKENMLGTYAQDMLAQGFEFVPVSEAPDDLKATFSQKKTRIVAMHKGRKVFALMGGLANPVHYAGAGMVQHQAEPPAKIMRLAASNDDPVARVASSLASAFRSLSLSTTKKNT